MNRAVGIDIGNEVVKIVCLDKTEGKYKLDAIGSFTYQGDMEKLKSFFDKANIEDKDIRVNIEDSSLKIRRLDIPPMEDKEMQESVKWGLKDVVEGDVEDYFYKYIKIDESDLKIDKKIPLIVFAVKKNAVNDRISVVEGLGLKNPKIIEPNAGALNVLYDYTRQGEQEENMAIVDLGSSFSLFVVMGKNSILFSRPLSGCSDSYLVDHIARDLGVSIKEAADVKTKFIFNPDTIDSDTLTKVKNTVLHFQSRLALEIQRSIDGYSLVFVGKKVSSILLTGGGAYYHGLRDYLKETLGFKVELYDPFKGININKFANSNIDKKKAIYAIACGLALD